MASIEIERAYHAILAETSGEDPARDGLVETPERAARAWAELTAGYGVNLETLLKTFDSEEYDEMVVVSGIPFASLCEHHLLPFIGTAHVVYIPDVSFNAVGRREGRIVGLSKIPRLVDAFAQRLQVQERMTIQIANALEEHLSPFGVMVILEAQHMCATLRGVKKPGMMMKTSAVRGELKKSSSARTEALNLIRG